MAADLVGSTIDGTNKKGRSCQLLGYAKQEVAKCQCVTVHVKSRGQVKQSSRHLLVYTHSSQI